MPNRVISITRRRWSLKGQLQGVGFRPFVYRLATELRLHGYVRNASSLVIIEAQGAATALNLFARRLMAELPPLARIETVNCEECETQAGDSFVIAASVADAQHSPNIPPDLAICGDCLREMNTPGDFRHQYPLINCTNCGPRFSIIRAMPYDRARTTMRAFELCEKCHQQYAGPDDRRFHAQPVACAACGPRVGLQDLPGGEVLWKDAIEAAARLLERGGILAIKGLGGFHLACRADDPRVVRELRRRKGRDAKPFAVMCADLPTARRLVELSDGAIAALTSPAAPIVLANAKWLPPEQADAIAPNNHRLGVMLPYTPLHHLLLAALVRNSSIITLVMTSANLTDEPLVKDNAEAATRLNGIADAILLHERDIERSIDDSVLIDLGDSLLPVRRARGYVPQVVRLAAGGGEPGLCVGGELKNTVALVRGDEAILSHHLGDLKHTLAYDYFRKGIDDLCRLMEVQPAWIAHDLHPTYLSTQWATQLAARWNVPLIPVQHHHAHAAALLAEHGIEEKALVLVCDGVGHGSDGSAWGGELLELDGGRFQRVAHLRQITLPGGDAAARDTRRCAAAVLHEVGESIDDMLVEQTERAIVEHLLKSGHRSVRSSAAGRLFDAAAALLGVCQRNTHEAQAAMTLESLAHSAGGSASAGRWSISERDGVAVVDLLPFVASLAGRKDAATAALAFHETFACAWADAVVRLASARGTGIVGLSGGVFCNGILTNRMSELLSAAGLRVLRHSVVPPNDGGIALGQALIARRVQTQQQR